MRLRGWIAHDDKAPGISLHEGRKRRVDIAFVSGVEETQWPAERERRFANIASELPGPQPSPIANLLRNRVAMIVIVCWREGAALTQSSTFDPAQPITQARAEFEKATKEMEYFAELPADGKPPLDLDRETMERYRPAISKFYLNKPVKFG